MNFIFGALLLHIFLNIIFRRFGITNANLYCGLFGGCFNQELTPVILQKLKILGYFNMSRGKDSCGYYNGKDIFKGAYETKEFYDFVVKNGLHASDNGNNLFIGHTRQGTYGSHSADNAHPFKVKENDSGSELVLAHNGTIENIWTLCYDYGVDSKDIHVDSLALACILHKSGPKVLNEYKGAAALLMHLTSEPNVMYVYHGMSKKYTGGIEIEERPLFWLKGREGVYLSSLKEPLDFIKEDGEEVSQVPHNVILKIENGVVNEEPVYIVDRGDANITVIQSYPTQQKPVSVLPTVKPIVAEPPKIPFPVITPVIDLRSFVVQESEKPPIPVEGDCNMVYYYHNRHRDKDGKLLEGPILISKKTGVITYSNIIGTDQRISVHYFHKGILIKDLSSWNKIKEALTQLENPTITKTALANSLTSSYINFAKIMSMYAKYPVTLLDGESVNWTKDRNLFYINGKPATESIQPLWSRGRIYQYSNGRLIDIINVNNKQDVIFYEKTIDNEAEPYSIDWYRKKFEAVYSNEIDMSFRLGDVGIQALSLYFEDVLKYILHKPYNSDLIDNLIDELIVHSIESKKPIINLLDNRFSDITVYLEEVLNSPTCPLVDTLPDRDEIDDEALHEEDDERMEIVIEQEQEKTIAFDVLEEVLEELYFIKNKISGLESLTASVVPHIIHKSVSEMVDDFTSKLVNQTLIYSNTALKTKINNIIKIA